VPGAGEGGSAHCHVGFRLLGPLEVRVGEQWTVVGGQRQARLLAGLLVRANRTLSPAEVAEAIWDDHPPKTVVQQVHNAVAALRRNLGPARDVIATHGAGYRAVILPGQLDSIQFEQAHASAKVLLSQGESEPGLELLDDALELWRGPALAGVGGRGAETAAAALAEVRLAVQQLLITSRLDRGEADAVLQLAEELAGRHPLRENVQRLLVWALHQAGRKADALTAFLAIRTRLIEELGVSPGPELCLLHEQILRDDPLLRGTSQRPVSIRPVNGLPPAQLPPDVPAFVGRTRELDQVMAGVHGAGALTVKVIEGMPGIGKTTLALRAAHRLAGTFPDGQLFVDLKGYVEGARPLDPWRALEGMLRSLGVASADIPEDNDQREALFRTCTAGRRLLIVLDNAAGESQVRPLLPGTADCLVLVTSRKSLTGLESAEAVPVGTLTRASSVELFRRIAGPCQDGADPALLDEVAGLCGDLPLALSIMASRLRARPSWTLAHVADRLRDQRLRLVELTAGERSVAAVFHLSYEQLSLAERTFFRRLGLHPGADFDAAAAAALTLADRGTAEWLLEHLTDIHLVEQPKPRRYRLHDLLRGYARQVEGDEGASAAVESLHRHYLDTAQVAMKAITPRRDPDSRSDRDHDQAMAWLDVEHGNLVAVAADMANRNAHAYLGDLSAVAWRYFDTRGHHRDALLLQTMALSAARAAGDKNHECHALLNRGIALWRLLRYDAALSHFENAVELAREIADRDLEVRALGNRGIVCWSAGRLDEAITCLNLVRDIAAQTGDLGAEARTLHRLGVIHTQRRQRERAQERLGAALELARFLRNRDLEAECLNALGIDDRCYGLAEPAIRRHREALDLAVASGNRNQQALSHRELCAAYEKLDDRGAARRHSAAATELYAMLGVPEPPKIS